MTDNSSNRRSLLRRGVALTAVVLVGLALSVEGETLESAAHD